MALPDVPHQGSYMVWHGVIPPPMYPLVTSATAQTCPVCSGRGQVASGFYDGRPTSAMHETCRSCGGSGVVWKDT